MILARVYVGDTAGGPVDYSTPFLETAAETAELPPLNPGESRRVAVRFVDSDTGLEELNTDAQIYVTMDMAGRDVSTVPPGPAGISLRDTGPGAALLIWQYNPQAGDEIPDAWDVYATPGNEVNYSVSEISITHNQLKTRYSYQLSGFVPGVAVAVAVRARKGAAYSPRPVALAWVPVGIPAPAAGVSATAVDYEV